jgi:triphosphoribosyl-dephospho-CoA synthase
MQTMPDETMMELELARQIHAACVWEATARKIGNVHPLASFRNLHFTDFILSAGAIAPILCKTRKLGLANAISESVKATKNSVGTNTNLGIILLFAPVAFASNPAELKKEIQKVIAEISIEETKIVYDAIQFASPGGMGKEPKADINDTPTCTLLEAMQLAQDRDLIAKQYADGYSAIFNDAIPTLGGALEQLGCMEGAIIFTHLYLMGKYPDSLIFRKCGPNDANESSQRARKVLEKQWPLKESGWAEFKELDRWLRMADNKRNPGATADLIAVTLFIALRLGQISLPLTFNWSDGIENALRRTAPDF